MNIRQHANRKGWTWWCPGCTHTHSINVDNSTGANWTFDGNVEQPTFSPSVLVRGTRHDLTEAEEAAFESECAEKGLTREQQLDHPVYGQRCHVFIRNGEIQFLSDCSHALKDTTVPIPEWPYAPGTFGGILELEETTYI